MMNVLTKKYFVLLILLAYGACGSAAMLDYDSSRPNKRTREQKEEAEKAQRPTIRIRKIKPASYKDKKPPRKKTRDPITLEKYKRDLAAQEAQDHHQKLMLQEQANRRFAQIQLRKLRREQQLAQAKKQRDQEAKDYALTKAVNMHDLAGIQAAVKSGANIEYSMNLSGLTPLMLYVKESFTKGIKVLLELDANPNTRVTDVLSRYHNDTAFLLAYKKNNFDLLQQLAAKKHEECSDYRVPTALNLAIEENNIKAIRILAPDDAEAIIEGMRETERRRLKTPAVYKLQREQEEKEEAAKEAARAQAAALAMKRWPKGLVPVCRKAARITWEAARDLEFEWPEWPGCLSRTNGIVNVGAGDSIYLATADVATPPQATTKAITFSHSTAKQPQQKSRGQVAVATKSPRVIFAEEPRIVMGKALRKKLAPATVEFLVPTARLTGTKQAPRTIFREARQEQPIAIPDRWVALLPSQKRTAPKAAQQKTLTDLSDSDSSDESDKEATGPECCICKSGINKERCTPKSHLHLPCGHNNQMHKLCLKKWYKTKKPSERTCPMCRAKVINLNPQLLAAAAGGSTKEVTRLLQQGAQLEAKNEYDQTPLILAIEHGHREVIIQLLHAGAQVDARDEIGQTPFLAALDLAHTNEVLALDVMEALCRIKPELVEDDNTDHHTALHIAVARQQINVIKKLIQLGAFLNNYNNYYYEAIEETAEIIDPCALATAVRLGNLELAQLLIDAGADVNILDEYYQGPSVISLAAQLGNREMFLLLIKAGAVATQEDYKAFYKKSGDKIPVVARRASRYVSACLWEFWELLEYME